MSRGGVMLEGELNTTASWLALLPPLSQLLHCLFLLCCRRRHLNLGHVQMSPMTGGKVRQRWALFDLSLCHQSHLCRDLVHWHCWEPWCCCCSGNSGHCLHCCCSSFQGSKRRKKSELGPEVGADYCPDAGWGDGAAAACQSSPPEAGGGSSCEHYGTWFCRTSWSRERGNRKTKSDMKAWKLKPCVSSCWRFSGFRLVRLTCHTACRGRNWPMKAQEPPLSAQTVCSLADMWALSMETEPIESRHALTDYLSCIQQAFHGFKSQNYTNTPYSSDIKHTFLFSFFIVLPFKQQQRKGKQ